MRIKDGINLDVLQRKVDEEKREHDHALKRYELNKTYDDWVKRELSDPEAERKRWSEVLNQISECARKAQPRIKCGKRVCAL